jgi:hypothetical protein
VEKLLPNPLSVAWDMGKGWLTLQWRRRFKYPIYTVLHRSVPDTETGTEGLIHGNGTERMKEERTEKKKRKGTVKACQFS